MKLCVRRWISLTMTIFIVIAFPSKSEFILQEIKYNFNYGIWYKEQTKYSPNSKWFGAWCISPKNDDIYLAFGTSIPAESDGAILAKLTNDSLNYLGTFSEQGIHLLKWLNDTLYSIGCDPSITDGWDSGNFYKYVQGESLLKIRYDSLKKPLLPNILHSWGFCIDPETKTFYMTTGSYDPIQYSKNNGDCGKLADSTLACFGEVWKSDDYGRKWQLIAGGKPNFISDFRIYDIIKFGKSLFITVGEQSGNTKLLKSTDNGKIWKEVIGIKPSALFRMTIFQNKLLIGESTYKRIFVMDSLSEFESHLLPSSLNYSFNNFVNIEDKYFATFFSDGSIKATSNFINWIELSPPSLRNFLAIAYWENSRSLLISERDSIGKIWKMDINELLSNDITINKNIEEFTITVINGEITIGNNNNNDFLLEIYDILGNKISWKNYTNCENIQKQNISSLSSGSYFLIIKYESKILTRKIMVNN